MECIYMYWLNLIGLIDNNNLNFVLYNILSMVTND